MTLEKLLANKKRIRVIGFDDAPFLHQAGSPVNVAGVVCNDTRFEGMLWGEVAMDGVDATEVLIEMLLKSKFYSQVHVVLTDGIALGGFNMIDLVELSEQLQRPCLAVMRHYPDLAAIDRALQYLPWAEQRRDILDRAGPVHKQAPYFFQAHGCDAKVAGEVLRQLTDRGHVPEVLRLAHMIGAAVKTGQSSNRA